MSVSPHPPSRREFLGGLGAAAAALTLPAGLAKSEPTSPETSAQGGLPQRPNILLIMADDMGFSDLGCYGADVVETPNLDRLGMGGMRFTQFYNCAKCAPTRASLLTGLYASQAGSDGEVAYLRHCATLGEALRPAGYRTWMTGKWHQYETPYQRGFDRYYGLCDGQCNYWNPGRARPGEPEPGRMRFGRWAIDGEEFAEWTPTDPDFFSTDAFTDHALQYLDETPDDAQPFLLHVCYTAPHFPLHAPPEDIAKYRGKFMHGWDELRERRHKRQLALGLLDPQWKLSNRDERAPAWADLSEPEQQDWDLRMAVYAAMIDRMDRNIGRLIRKLEETGQLENTLIMFLSDNGGCAESFNLTPDIDPGPVESFRTLDLPWANATNTPFRKFKRRDHEGGISTPFIAHWPGVIPPGRINHDVAHVIDVMPTLLELAGGTYPQMNRGEPVVPCEGLSLTPLLRGESRAGHELLCWEYRIYAAARRGRWKILRSHPTEPWELYDMVNDRTETTDRAKDHPEIVLALALDYDRWATRVRVAEAKVEAAERRAANG